MIVWRGKGLLVPLAFILGGALTNIIFMALHLNVSNRADSIILGCMMGIF